MQDHKRTAEPRGEDNMAASLLPPTHFSRITRFWAASVLGMTVVLIGVGLALGMTKPTPFRSVPGLGGGDAALYVRIINDVAAGESYHHAAVREQRHWGYTLRPVWTVREPVLAHMLARIPEPARPAPLAVLAVLTMLVWSWRAQRASRRPVMTALVFTALFFGLLYAFARPTYPFHECWAGMLMALSLGLSGRRDWQVSASVGLGLTAALIRELAAPYLVVMLAMALWEKRWREAVAWSGALMLFAGAIWWHAQEVAGLLTVGDRVSHGWLGLGGWPYLLALAHWNGLTVMQPEGSFWLIALLFPLMLLGCCAIPGGRGCRLMLTVGGYCTGFLFWGRPDTVYWGFLLTPLWGLGLAYSLPALVDLVNRILCPAAGRGLVK